MAGGADGPVPDRFMASVPFQYGWIILGAGALGAFMTTPGQTVGVSAFFDPIIQDLGASRSAAATAYAAGTLLGILPTPFVGHWIDRHGVRLAAFAAGTALAAACVGMALVRNALELTLAFALLRAAAVGGLTLLSQHVINLWFVRQRGIAAAAVVGGTALGGVVFPLAIEGLLPGLGWRATYVALGGVTAFVVAPLLVLLFRDGPETFGLRPDLNNASKSERSPVDEPRVSIRQAMRTRTFWVLTVAGFLGNMVGTALLLHQVAILAAGGLERGAAVALLAPMAAVQAIAIPVSGLLIDKLGVRRLLPLLLIMLGSAAVFAATAHATIGGWAYAVALGAALGGLNTAQAAGYAEAFGRSNMGSIRGVGFLAAVLGAALGPLPPVWSLAVSGRYDLALWLFAGASIVAAASAFAMRPREASIL